MVQTFLGRIFRYESRNATGLERLWEYNVRELVILGTEQKVKAGRALAAESVRQLLDELSFEFTIESATDAFFPTARGVKKFWQLSRDVKWEVLLPLERRAGRAVRTFAIGSINDHRNFFGRQFDIKGTDRIEAFSACVGIGIERLLLAAFTQFGFDPAAWPAALRPVFDA